ncbi:DUF1045 domain-containing protein [Rhodalgimonas zhirmunskyi]|uniref:DUF1045 domain-containing protein n=1 Tax=Rhodalgimonas zhirmunskyi TaxID=2964767 RepID=A0AAJ1UED0_9RHOB|nr:DUF1045 domain-containing protein [Rhodoalgimonas zhirmunskyi]MDQ2095943.1 DUF1045 domain-containing protein [Rhodoalgimonas zhirmunskyi]
MKITRHAIYYAPEPGPLARFGAAWLGWDADTGTPVPHPDVPGLPLPLEEITQTPRKYGLHGTIKPPFRLSEGLDQPRLEQAISDLCHGLSPVTLDGLALSALGSFLALTPTGDMTPLSDLAAEVVRALDPFRAPATEEELEKRRNARLSPRQEANLIRWGYPYVMEDFRFHITLTGRLPKSARKATEAALAPVLALLLPHPFKIESLCHFGEDERGRFHLLKRYPLGE